MMSTSARVIDESDADQDIDVKSCSEDVNTFGGPTYVQLDV